MKILVLGSTGFVGQNLCDYLSGFPFLIKKLSLRSIDWKANFNGDAVIHLAGKAHDTKNTSDASEYFNVNTNLTKEIFDLFLENEARDFIYFSSVKAVADEVKEILYEDIIGNPKTPYGESKLQAEEYILSKKIPEKKRVFIIR